MEVGRVQTLRIAVPSRTSAEHKGLVQSTSFLISCCNVDTSVPRFVIRAYTIVGCLRRVNTEVLGFGTQVVSLLEYGL